MGEGAFTVNFFFLHAINGNSRDVHEAGAGIKLVLLKVSSGSHAGHVCGSKTACSRM